MPHFHIQKCGVVVSKDAALFVRQWKTAFVWHVVDADPSVRSGDGVILVEENDNLLATRQAKLSRIRIAAIPSRGRGECADRMGLMRRMNYFGGRITEHSIIAEITKTDRKY